MKQSFAKNNPVHDVPQMLGHLKLLAQVVPQNLEAADQEQLRQAVATLSHAISIVVPVLEASHEAATVDSLTQVYNRGYFHASLSQALKTHQAETAVNTNEQRKPAQTYAVIMIDLDGFKQINDRLGHAAGDKALEAIAHQLAMCTRKTDIVCRLGGDEFAVIMPLTDERGGLAAAERLQKDIEMTTFEWGGERYRVKASIGIVEVKPGQSLEEVMDMADRKMYEVKKEKGDTRNQPPEKVSMPHQSCALVPA